MNISVVHLLLTELNPIDAAPATPVNKGSDWNLEDETKLEASFPLFLGHMLSWQLARAGWLALLISTGLNAANLIAPHEL